MGADSSSFPFGAVAAGASGVLGSILSSISANSSLKAQREENALNRQFNAEEAEKNRQFQRQMFDAENAYNDPKRVISRLMSAGLNPALAFGNMANSASAVGGDSASYGNGVNPAMPDWSGIQSAGRAALDNEMMQAQIKLAESQANKNNAEIPWIDRIYSLDEELKKLGVNLGNEDLNLKKETGLNMVEARETMIQERENLKQTLENLKTANKIQEKQLSILDSEDFIKKVEASFAERKQEAELNNALAQFDNIKAAADLSRAERIRILGLLAYEQQNLMANTALATNNSQAQYYQNQITESEIKQVGLGKLGIQRYNDIASQIDFRQNTAKTQRGMLRVEQTRTKIMGLNSCLQVGTSILKLM